MAREEPTRVLLIEDDPDDAWTVRRMLEEVQDTEFELRMVGRLDGGLECLAENGIDVVLLDLNLPDSLGLETLSKTRAQDADVPIVVVTALDDPELAVEATTADAQDYLVKGRWDGALLRASIRYAIERKRVEQALRDSERSYRVLAEAAHDHIYVVGSDCRIRYANSVAASHMSLPADAAAGKRLQDLCEAETFQQQSDHLQQVIRTGRPVYTESRMVFPDGESWYGTSMAPVANEKGGIDSVLCIARDISERKATEEELQHTLGMLRGLLGGVIQSIAAMVESRDPYTAGHQQRVADLARSIANEMHLSKRQIEGLRTAASIHDLGKTNVPTDILAKPGHPSDLEMGIIKTHPDVGYDILKPIEFPWPVAEIVRQHHERTDGSGYPRGLTGSEMLTESKILGVADTVEAMTTHRPYRPALGLDTAIDEIISGKGTRYDRDVVDACVRIAAREEIRLAAAA